MYRDEKAVQGRRIRGYKIVGIDNFSYIQKGKGKDLLFLHGYLSSKEAFSYQIEYFSKFYRVTAVDFLGFGQSGPLQSPYSVGEYADWLYRVLCILQVQKPHVIAHSFGCRVAIKGASDRANLFDKMILTGPAGVILRRGVGYHLQVRAYRAVKKIAPKFAEKKFGSAEYRTLSPIMKESYKKIVNEDLRACAKKVQNSVLIVQGEQDRVTPMQATKEYIKCFPHARLRVISGDHFAFLRQPLTFNLLTEEFLYGHLV